MSSEDQFARIQAEERVKEEHSVALQFRKFLSGALCAVCGEPLGEAVGNEPWITQDDDDRTMHARCYNEGNGPDEG